MGMWMGTGKFTREWGWGIFCGDGVGMGNISWGRDGDGENFVEMGREWGQFYLPCHSLVTIRCCRHLILAVELLHLGLDLIAVVLVLV